MNHIPDVLQTGVVPLCGVRVRAGDRVGVGTATCPTCIEIAAEDRTVYWPWLAPEKGAS